MYETFLLDDAVHEMKEKLDKLTKESFENEILEVRPCDQFLWVERFISAVEMPEITPKEMLVKYDEIYRIHKEFGATAAYFGRVIIREYFLPLEQKSIKPVASKKADAGGYRYKFEICNIRFKLATDEHGICNAISVFANMSDDFISQNHGCPIIIRQLRFYKMPITIALCPDIRIQPQPYSMWTSCQCRALLKKQH